MCDFTHLKTQKAIKQYTREIIDEICLCDNIKNEYPEYYFYFTTFLFPRHPAYPQKFINLKNIGIQKNKLYGHFEVYLIFDNGKTDSVSVMSQCACKRPSDNYLSSAMRMAISSQIYEYKNNSLNLNCVKCDSDENIQVDHYKPQFIDLQKNFLENTNLKIPTSFDSHESNKAVFKTRDFEFSNAWCNYHLYNATLRPLCKTCNITRKKSKTKYKDICLKKI